jgi:hypothetical protein
MLCSLVFCICAQTLSSALRFMCSLGVCVSAPGFVCLSVRLFFCRFVCLFVCLFAVVCCFLAFVLTVFLLSSVCFRMLTFLASFRLLCLCWRSACFCGRGGVLSNARVTGGPNPDMYIFMYICLYGYLVWRLYVKIPWGGW